MMMQNLNYYRTFIRVAPDCPAEKAEVPPGRGAAPSVAQLEYELLQGAPYRITQEELLFRVHVRRLGIPPAELKSKRLALRDEFFSKPMACLRASPLAKRYGWGFHFDAKGRIALLPRESAEYLAFAAGQDGVKVLDAMRSKRG